MFRLAPFDPALSPAHCIRVNRLWAGGRADEEIDEADASNPRINPFSGEVSLLGTPCLPPRLSAPTTKDGEEDTMRITLVSGAYDILHADILIWLARAEEAKLKVHYIEGVKQVHDFPTGRKNIWEGRVATDMVVDNVAKNSLELGF